MKKIFSLMMILFVTSSFAAGKKETKEEKKVQPKIEVATFGAGCFWCVQPVFDKATGVLETHVGFSGGDAKKVTYKEVSTGKTGHAEAIEVTFDPSVTTYEKILKLYWENIDPTDGGGQFVDRGSQYRPVIFYHNEEQRKQAEESKARLDASKKFPKPIATEIVAYKFFVPVEGGEADIHEKYYQKNPMGYELYKKGSGREKILKEIHDK